jgi:hypothetical protein
MRWRRFTRTTLEDEKLKGMAIESNQAGVDENEEE